MRKLLTSLVLLVACQGAWAEQWANVDCWQNNTINEDCYLSMDCSIDRDPEGCLSGQALIRRGRKMVKEFLAKNPPVPRMYVGSTEVPLAVKLLTVSNFFPNANVSILID